MPAYGNWGSYNNKRVDELLDEIAKADPNDEATMATLYGDLQAIILKELPYIPGWFYGPFYMYSTTYWTNWPAANNTYSGGVPYWDTCRGWYPMLFGLQSTAPVATTMSVSTAFTNTTSAIAPAPPIGTIAVSLVVIVLVVSLAVAIVRRRSRRVED